MRLRVSGCARKPCLNSKRSSSACRITISPSPTAMPSGGSRMDCAAYPFGRIAARRTRPSGGASCRTSGNAAEASISARPDIAPNAVCDEPLTDGMSKCHGCLLLVNESVFLEPNDDEGLRDAELLGQRIQDRVERAVIDAPYTHEGRRTVSCQAPARLGAALPQ